MAIQNALGQAGGTGTQVLVSTGGATAPAFADVETAALPIISGATYETFGEFNIANLSSGVITGCAMTDGGSGTIDVAAGSFMIRSTASDVGNIFSADFAAVTGQALTDNSINFVFIDYNSGSPVLFVATTPATPAQNFVVVGVVWREGSTVFITEVNVPTSQVSQKLSRRFALVDGVTRQVGAVVGASGTRNVTITAGAFWVALAEHATTAFDSSAAGTWIYYYSDGAGGFTEITSSTQINNTQYDDGSGSLATLANNQFGVHWVYLSIDDAVYVVFGEDTYTLTEAQAALTPSSLPIQITPLHSALLAKIIIGKSDSSFTAIESAFDTAFIAGLASDHGDLSGLQGGTTGEYFHLTSAEYGLTGIMTGNGGSIMSASTVTEDGVLIAGASNAVASLTVGTDGQLLVGDSADPPVFATAASSDSSITFALGAGTFGLTVTQAGEAQLGGAQTATDAEAVAGTETGVMIVPSSLSARLLAPGAIGTTTGCTELVVDDVNINAGIIQGTAAATLQINATAGQVLTLNESITVDGSTIRDTAAASFTVGATAGQLTLIDDSNFSVDGGVVIVTGDLTVDSLNMNGATLGFGATAAILVDTIGGYTSPNQPCFSANTAAQTSVTGDNTNYVITFTDSEIFDQNSDFDGTSTYTCPITSRNLLILCVTINDFDNASHTKVIHSCLTSNRVYSLSQLAKAAVDGGNLSITCGVLADMDAADISTMKVDARGSSKTVDIEADTGYFMGCILA